MEMPAAGESPGAPRPGPRYLAVVLFVGAWMACGWLLRLDPNLYLVLGVPPTVLFQRLVRREPIRGLWVRDAPPFRPGWKGLAIALLLALVPLAGLAGSAVEREWIGCVFYLCALAGAVGAAYALRHFRREQVRPLAWCLLVTLTLDSIQWSLFLGTGLIEMRPFEGGTLGRVAVGVMSLLEYMVVVFALEEVTFRMLDTHLHEADGRVGIPSAVFISAAWGLWHLPIGEGLSWGEVGVLLYVHVPYGVCLSLFWRKTGNLWVPALCHALGDAIRNGIMAGG